MMDHWSEVFTLTRNIECSSLVTRIAQTLGLLNICLLSYIPEQRTYIDFDYFRQAHMLKAKEDGSIIMMYRKYMNEIPLPN